MDRYCPKHVEFYTKNKFERFVLLVGFIIRIKNKLYGIIGTSNTGRVTTKN